MAPGLLFTAADWDCTLVRAWSSPKGNSSVYWSNMDVDKYVWDDDTKPYNGVLWGLAEYSFHQKKRLKPEKGLL